jgi:hypothetical protein
LEQSIYLYIYSPIEIVDLNSSSPSGAYVRPITGQAATAFNARLLYSLSHRVHVPPPLTQCLCAYGCLAWLGVAGTLVLRRFRDPFAVGAWFGGLVVLANLMLCMCVNAADRVLFGNVDGGLSGITDVAVAVFATLLCMLYTILAGQVFVFRSHLLGTTGSAPVPSGDCADDSDSSGSELVFVRRIPSRTGHMMGVVES